MKVSVITVTFNSAPTIEQTIRSVLDQDHKDIEYIVVDGGSTDGTVQVVEKYLSSLTKFVSEKDNGLYDALNKGIKMASGDVVALLHGDDFYTATDVLSSYVKVFETCNCDAVYADLYYVDRKDTGIILRHWKSGNYKEGDFLKGWMPPHPTFVVRREMYEKYGYFREDFNSAADYELMLRFIQKHRIRIAYLDRFTVKMRAGGESNKSIGNRIRANSDDRRAWKVNGLKPGILTLWLKPLRKISQFW